MLVTKYWRHGPEWEPININDEFVKFKGEENCSIEELQNGFFSCMEKSDAYVISNPNSYEGYMVSIEFGFATQCILSRLTTLKKIYFTNTPLGYDKFISNPNLTFDAFLKDLYSNPSYQNELSYFKKCTQNADPLFHYDSERDFYDDLKDMYGKTLLLQSRGGLVIGLDSLLSKDKNTVLPNDQEHEL